MRDIFTIKIDNEEYVHIDTIKYKDQILYHFGSLADEIFCIKNNEQYVPINDSFQVSLIKNKLGLINTKYIFNIKDEMREIIEETNAELNFYLKLLGKRIKYRDWNAEVVGQEEKEKINDEQIDNFTKAKEKLNLDINLDEIKQKISRIKLIKKDILHRGRNSGYYNPIHNVIALKTENDIDSDNIHDKRTRFHEHIHAMTGKKCLLYNLGMMRGFLEGETENLVEDFWGDGTSSFINYENKDKIRNIQFNFSRDTTYKPQVSIIKQMEHALGKKSHDSIINGNMEFESEFAKKYGKSLMIFMAYRSRMLLVGKHINEWFKENEPFDEVKYFKETQDILMKKVFEKDFGNIENIDDAKLYFQKLRGFETVRGRISTQEKYSDRIVEDTSFEEYYNEKYKTAVEILKSKGIDETEIESELEQYKYEKQKFNSYRTKKEEKEFIKEILINEMAEKSIQDRNLIDGSQYDFSYTKVLEDSYYINLKKRDNMQKYNFSIVSQNDEKAFDEFNERFDFEKNGYKEEKIEFADGEFQDRIIAKLRMMDDRMLEDIYNEIASEDDINEKKEKLRKMQKREVAIKHILDHKIHNEYNTEPEVLKKETLEKSEPVIEGIGVGTSGPVEKRKKLLGLISLNKFQDRQIEQLSKESKEKGMTFNE